MSQITLSEGHKEANPLYAGNVFGQGFDLLVMQQIHILFAHLGEIILPLDAHGRDLDPFSVLPVRAGGGNLSELQFRIEVCCKWIAVIAAITLKNIDCVNHITIMLHSVSGEYARIAEIKTAAQHSRQTGFFKLILISPLPGIIEISGKAKTFAPLLIAGSPSGIFRVLRL